MKVTCKCGNSFYAREGEVECYRCGRTWFQPKHRRGQPGGFFAALGAELLKNASTSRPNKECWSCGGTGYYGDRRCRKCEGTGIFDPARRR
jgi:hypothetical protein